MQCKIIEFELIDLNFYLKYYLAKVYNSLSAGMNPQHTVVAALVVLLLVVMLGNELVVLLSPCENFIPV
jgi:hypothetical protein